MNKPSNDGEAAVFLVVLGVIGIALPACLCAAGFLFFSFAAPAPLPAVSVGTMVPATWAAGPPTTMATPANSNGPYTTPTTSPPSGIEIE